MSFWGDLKKAGTVLGDLVDVLRALKIIPPKKP